MELKSLKNIQSAFSYVKTVTVTVVITSALVALLSAAAAYFYAEKQREKIYVLDQGKSLILALAQDASQNRPAEAREHIRRFHELFFTLSPDKSQIEGNTARALAMADRSAYECYRDIAESGYYSRIVSADITQTVTVDSIRLDLDSHPYRAVTYCTQKIIRKSTVTARMLKTECVLVNTSRSDDNPAGFQIRSFRITENKDIRTTEK